MIDCFFCGEGLKEDLCECGEHVKCHHDVIDEMIDALNQHGVHRYDLFRSNARKQLQVASDAARNEACRTPTSKYPESASKR